jgi:DNA mismatch repair ATPase MutS
MLFAATHDIELTYILEKYFKLYHFEEKVEDDGVTFDYKLKDGRAVTRNAILLLKMLGFENEITEKAEKAADKYIESGEWEEI